MYLALIKKLNLSQNIHDELVTTASNINSLFLLSEPIEHDYNWWSIDKSKNFQLKQIGSFEHDDIESVPIKVCDYDYVLKENSQLPKFFQKYKLNEFMGTALEQNFQIHKHIFSGQTGLSCYTIAIFTGEGVFDVVEPIDYIDPNPKFDTPHITYFSTLPKDVKYKKIFSTITQPGDIYCFNTWLYHTFTTVEKPRTHVFYLDNMQTETQFNDYIKYIEAL